MKPVLPTIRLRRETLRVLWSYELELAAGGRRANPTTATTDGNNGCQSEATGCGTAWTGCGTC